jgi:hypothetical protein
MVTLLSAQMEQIELRVLLDAEVLYSLSVIIEITLQTSYCYVLKIISFRHFLTGSFFVLSIISQIGLNL